MSVTVQTRPLISMYPSATVQEAAQLMNDCSIACVGVLDTDKKFAGIVTERDVTAFVSRGKDPGASLVAEITNDFPVVVEGPISDEGALERMKSAHIRHLIVHEAGDYRIVHRGLPCQRFFEEVAEGLADGDISGMPVVDDRGRLPATFPSLR